MATDKEHVHYLLDQLDPAQLEAAASVLAEMTGQPAAPPKPNKKKLGFWAALFQTRVLVSGGLALVSLLLAFVPWPFWDEAGPTKASTIGRGIVLALWTIVPPLYFLIEYAQSNEDDPDEVARLKYLQDLSSKLWAGMLAALTILYFGKDILHKG
jgi:hypothetical protein